MKSNKKYNSGIYKITNLVNGKFYIGSATDLRKRKSRHFNDLLKNKHRNKYLQNSYNKYNKKDFKFEILEYINILEMLIVREQWYLNWWFDWGNRCYNLLPIAGSSLGIKHTDESKKKMSEIRKNFIFSDESKKKMSKAKMGKKLSEETRRKISESKKGKKYKSKNIS